MALAIDEAAFVRGDDSVAAPIEAQLALGAEPWPGDVVVRVRMGLHTGEELLSSTEDSIIRCRAAGRSSLSAKRAQTFFHTSSKLQIHKTHFAL
jgi:hypothetical protein